MNRHRTAWAALALASLLLAACKGKADPVKPTVTPPSAIALLR